MKYGGLVRMCVCVRECKRCEGMMRRNNCLVMLRVFFRCKECMWSEVVNVI